MHRTAEASRKTSPFGIDFGQCPVDDEVFGGVFDTRSGKPLPYYGIRLPTHVVFKDGRDGCIVHLGDGGKAFG